MLKVIFLIASFFLSGCMLGPNYHRPYIDTPDEYMYERAKTNNDTDFAWWEQFEDPVLVDLIEEAVANNENLQTATANIREALGLLIQIRAPLFPQLGYTGSYSRTRYSETSITTTQQIPPSFSFKNPSTSWEALVTGSWELDIWGRTQRLTEAAEANLYATCQARRAVLLSLVSSVANNYIFLRGLDAQLSISIDTMNSYKEEVDYFEKQFKYGQTSEMSVAQAKTQYETAAAQIPQIKTKIIQLENALSTLLGSNPKTIPRGKSIYELKMPPVPSNLPSELLCQRPDIMQSEENLIAANAQIGAAKALYFPSISLTGYFGGVSPQLSDLFSGPSRSWNFTGTVTGPIFTGGSIYGQVLQAKAIREAALHIYRETIKSAFADVENAFAAHFLLLRQIESEQRLVEAAGQYQHLATLQYKGGYSPYFVVIQAQEQFFPAQLAWARTKSEIFGSLVNIYQALGGGWITLADALHDDSCSNSCCE